MRNTEQDSRTQTKFPKTGCLIVLALVFLFFTFTGAALGSLFILDSGYTMSERKDRYKVACQFIWVDFKRWLSRQFSDEPPPDENDPFF